MVEFYKHIGPAEVPFRGKWCNIKDAPSTLQCPKCGLHMHPVYSGAFAFYDVKCDECKRADYFYALRPARIDDESWKTMKEFFPEWRTKE